MEKKNSVGENSEREQTTGTGGPVNVYACMYICVRQKVKNEG